EQEIEPGSRRAPGSVIGAYRSWSERHLVLRTVVGTVVAATLFVLLEGLVTSRGYQVGSMAWTFLIFGFVYGATTGLTTWLDRRSPR
ncbi:MAG: hypothetical protein ACREQ5_38575, partial [Candidatus Dormibacteria bacterium]